ncbi:TerD domain-containing protein [Xylariaceae sp. FL1019]|nr:TerD domain-containing protein [Xylariaceae sp. FL1019]
MADTTPRPELTKDPLPNEVTFGLGWDAPKSDKTTDDTPKLDLDLWAIINQDGKPHEDVCFYGTEKDGKYFSKCQSIQLTNDNRTGDGDGDDEQLLIQLNKLPAATTSVDILVVVHDEKDKAHNLSQAEGAVCRLIEGINGSGGKAIDKFELPFEGVNNKSVKVMTLRREKGGWYHRRDATTMKKSTEELLAEYKFDKSQYKLQKSG